MAFDDWLDAAWNAHAADPAGVAATLRAEAVARCTCDAEVLAAAHLAQHVHGAHLGDWAGGQALLAALRGHAACGERTAGTIAIFDASLALAADADAVPAPGATPSQRVRTAALASGHLATRDAPRAQRLLLQAREQAAAAALADDDPAVRALAANGNNIAVALEELPARSDAERELMVLAAQTGRDHWARAGTWLEVERAEYRLARSWLAAGDRARARGHATACLEIVRAHGEPALELFFAWEAMAAVAADVRDAPVLTEALSAMQAAFARLDEGDRATCAAALDRLRAASGALRTPT